MTALVLTLAATSLLTPVGSIAAQLQSQTQSPSQSPTQQPSSPGLVSSRRIWDVGAHNAFTDLLRFKDAWFCVFREGRAHVSPDGAIRVLRSSDGETWTSAALLRSERGDLRDPKLVATPDGRMMLSAAIALPQGAGAKHQTAAWFSADGTTWGEPIDIGEPDNWLWRVTWNGPVAYGVGYQTDNAGFVRLYKSADGRAFETLVPRLFDAGYPNESSIVFQADQRAICLLRRDGNPGAGLVGLAKPPYTDWEWKDLGVRIGGPHLLRLNDGRLVAAVRFYDGGARTSLAWLDPAEGRLTEWLRLPSGGDTSYAGLQVHEGLLWVSYYSSHEGKTAIYLAKVSLPDPARP